MDAVCGHRRTAEAGPRELDRQADCLNRPWCLTIPLRKVEVRGLEPLASTLPASRSPN